MSTEFQSIIAQLDANAARTAAYLDDLLTDYERTMIRLREGHPVSHEVSAAVRSLESLAAEALQLVALMSHRGGDHEGAHRAVDQMRRLEEITVAALRS
jgi:hypothetical protein